ncbi:hypothetical protein J7K50_10000 [bacterium]|nr:hypothetical protein [bacterium]
MLYSVSESRLDFILDSVVGRDSPVHFSLKSWATISHPDVPRPAVLTDNLENPSVVILCGVDWMTGWTKDDDLWLKVFRDVLMGEGEFPRGFPSPGGWRGGSVSMSAVVRRPYLFLGQVPSAMTRGALEAGFIAEEDDIQIEPAAEFWYLEGEPRFSEHVKHPCRVCEGLGLFELIRAGWPYGDAEGTYIKECLLTGPSFVCEVDGEPVCASATHLSRTMGMIYTPEELRGRGYASSLAAFQVDEMLRRDGIASAHIWHSNEPSRALVKKLGFERFAGWFGWYRLFFPETQFLP